MTSGDTKSKYKGSSVYLQVDMHTSTCHLLPLLLILHAPLSVAFQFILFCCTTLAHHCSHHLTLKTKHARVQTPTIPSMSAIDTILKKWECDGVTREPHTAPPTPLPADTTVDTTVVFNHECRVHFGMVAKHVTHRR